MKLLRSILILIAFGVQIQVQHAAHELTHETLNFETLLSILQSNTIQSGGYTKWEQLLENKALHHKISLLIADHLLELVEHETLEMALRLKDFFKITLNKSNKQDKYLMRKSILNIYNFKQLIFGLNEKCDDKHVPRVLFECFFVFSDDDYDSQDISNDHYNLIFLYRTGIYSESYWCAKDLIIKRLLEESSAKKLTTLQWIDFHKDELDLEIIYLIALQLSIKGEAQTSIDLLGTDEARSFFLCFCNLSKYNKNNFLEALLIKALNQKNSLDSQIDDIPLHTAHDKHFVRNFDLKHIFFISPFMRNLELSDLVRKINEKTKELQDNYYTFVHAQHIKFYPLQQWYTTLRSLVENSKIVQDYCYPWIVEPIEQEKNDEEINYHEQLKKEGCYARSLFMNYALFANLSCFGCSSAHYFISNSNAFTGKMASEYLYDTFEALQLTDVYKKYKNQLEEHAATFDQLSTFGNMLFIAVPKATISQSVYLSDGDASRRTINIEGIGETDDIALIMETLEKHPEKIEDTDFMQFCLIMTQSPYGGGLNPESGIKIIPFNCIKQEKLQEFEREKAELLAMIKDEIELAKIRRNTTWAEDISYAYTTQ